MHRRGEPRQHQRVGEEDRAEDGRRLDEHVAGVGAERSLEHAAANGAAKPAFLGLLEQDHQRQQQAGQHLDYIEKADEDSHFPFLPFVVLRIIPNSALRFQPPVSLLRLLDEPLDRVLGGLHPVLGDIVALAFLLERLDALAHLLDFQQLFLHLFSHH